MINKIIQVLRQKRSDEFSVPVEQRNEWVSKETTIVVDLPEMRTYRDVNDIRAHSREAGKHFFDPKTMAFWKTTVTTKTYGEYGNVFITGDTTPSDPARRYTVRIINPVTAAINDVSSFRQFETLAEARRWVEAQTAKGGE